MDPITLRVTISRQGPIFGTFFIEAKPESGSNPAYKQLDIKVCGFEQITVVATENYEKELSKFWSWYTVRESEFVNFFSNNDSVECPTTEYRLLDETA